MYIANTAGDTVKIKKIDPDDYRITYLVFEKENTIQEIVGGYQYGAWMEGQIIINTLFYHYSSYNVYDKSQHFLIAFKNDTVEIFKKEFVSIAKDAFWEINEEDEIQSIHEHL